MRGRSLDSSGSECGRMADRCECGNEPSGSLKCGGISWLAEALLRSQAGRCSVELITCKSENVRLPVLYIFMVYFCNNFTITDVVEHLQSDFLPLSYSHYISVCRMKCVVILPRCRYVTAFRVLVPSGVASIATCCCLALGREMKLDKNYQVRTCRSNNLKTSEQKYRYLFNLWFIGRWNTKYYSGYPVKDNEIVGTCVSCMGEMTGFCAETGRKMIIWQTLVQMGG
jgi:hypothetical protein